MSAARRQHFLGSDYARGVYRDKALTIGAPHRAGYGATIWGPKVYDRAVVLALTRLSHAAEGVEAAAIRAALARPQTFTRWCRRNPDRVRDLIRGRIVMPANKEGGPKAAPAITDENRTPRQGTTLRLGNKAPLRAPSTLGTRAFRRGARVRVPPPKIVDGAPQKFFDPECDERAFIFIWMVGGRAPRRRHAQLASALQELRRLKQLEPTRRFIVYRASAIGGDVS